jgi:RNA polymerase sigma factor (sigma-70 family)
MTDADLVAASRSGDRDAFAQIVRRYQGMVSGLIYAACGDLHRSEDLAQETFLSAWKSLSGLREPAKLPAWLCQIARHRTQDQQRRSVSEKVGVGGFWARQSESSTSPSPDAELIRKEEEAVLWRALAAMPQPYRETLVLYYRQGQSADEVAAAMETSEPAVRQRLSRGREMLRAEVAQMIERNLTRSAPSPAFATAVIAALPALLPEATKAAGVGTAVKGSLAANFGWLGALAAWMGMVGGMGGGIVASISALQDDRTPVERRLTVRFLIRLWSMVAILLVGCGALFHLRGQLHWSDATHILLLSGWFSLYWACISALILRYHVHSRAVRGNRPPPPPLAGSRAVLMSAGPVVGALAWMIHLSLAAGDTLSAGIVAAAIVAISAFGLRLFRRHPGLIMPAYTIALCGAIVVMVNWRLDAWIAAIRGVDPSQLHLPLWSVNVAAAALIVWVAVLYRICYPPTGPRTGRLSLS